MFGFKGLVFGFKGLEGFRRVFGFKGLEFWNGVWV